MSQLLTALRVLEVLILITGGTISFLAFRGARRNKSTALLIISLGFTIIALGSFGAGFFFEFFSAQDLQALLETRVVQAGTQLLGFILILYALFGRSR